MSAYRVIPMCFVVLAVHGVVAAQVNFLETFSDNSAGWSLNNLWQIGPATPSCCPPPSFFPDPATDADNVVGGGVAGVVIGGNVPLVNRPFFYITSPVIDTSSAPTLALVYDRWLNSDANPRMDNRVQVFDGLTWVTVWQAGLSNDGAWATVTHDVTPYKNPSFRVRFGTSVTVFGNSLSVGGFNLDNVRVVDPQVLLAGFPVGQSPVPGVAVLNVNNATSSILNSLVPVSTGFHGPYFTAVSSTGTLNISFAGAPNQAIVLLAGPLSVGANPIAPYGQLDMGAAFFSGIDIVASGTDPGLINSLLRLNPAGQQILNAQVPLLLVGTSFTLQALMLHPTLLVQASNAVNVTFLP